MIHKPRQHPIYTRGDRARIFTNRRPIIGGGGHSPGSELSYEDTVAALGASNYWPLQETGTPTTVADVIGSHAMTMWGTVKPLTEQAGLRPNATSMYFNGVSSCIIDNGAGPPPGWTTYKDTMSLSCLMKRDGPMHHGLIMCTRNSSTHNTFLFMIRSDSLKFRFDVYPSSEADYLDSVNNVDGNVNHCVVTQSPANGRKMYINGALNNSLAGVETYTGNAVTNFYFGVLGASLYFKGWLSDMALYPKELSSAEAAQLYAASGL
jgi:hypothetical protein